MAPEGNERNREEAQPWPGSSAGQPARRWRKGRDRDSKPGLLPGMRTQRAPTCRTGGLSAAPKKFKESWATSSRWNLDFSSMTVMSPLSSFD